MQTAQGKLSMQHMGQCIFWSFDFLFNIESRKMRNGYFFFFFFFAHKKEKKVISA